MAIKLSREQIFYIAEAACDLEKYGEIKRKCPLCGNAMEYLPRKNGAYTIKCKTEGCIEKDYRGI